jgi:hypothetical protein
MFKTYASAVLAAMVAATPFGANGYSRGVPPTTQNCNGYPTSGWSTNFASQSIAWGLEVDREFGGCRCADEDEMEFQPSKNMPAQDTWACRCLNEDLYTSKPTWGITCAINPSAGLTGTVFDAAAIAQDPTHISSTNTVAFGAPAAGWTAGLASTNGASNTWVERGTVCGGNSNGTVYLRGNSGEAWAQYTGLTTANTYAVINDVNGKRCGIIQECRDSAVQQQRNRWNQEAARALQTKDAARVYAKKSMMPDNEISRARVLRLKMTKENKIRARVQVAALSMKYRAVKNAMLAGSLDKSAFEKAYKLTARQIAQYRAQFASRQRDIEESWNLVV